MDNRNKPIYPFKEKEDTELGDFIIYHKGLTKREYFAGIILQGILASDIKQEYSMTSMIETAIEGTDELLEKLENGTKNHHPRD